MNSVNDILSYSITHDIQLYAKGDYLILNAPKDTLTDEFMATAKQYKTEILSVINERWDPEYAAEGYVWCLDCQYFNGVNCNHADNPFHTVTKCSHAPRKCQWYEE